MRDAFIWESGLKLTSAAVKLNEDVSINYTAPFMPLCAISPVNSSSGITAVSDGWLVIVVDMMKWRGAFGVAPSCCGRKRLWWISEVLTEVRGIAAHLPALLSLRHKQSTLTNSPRHHHFPLHLIPPFHRRFPSVIFALLSSILQPGHAQCSPRLRRPDSLPSAPPSPPLLHPSCRLFSKRRLSQTHPRLHLLSSSLLILPSVSIRADCCHFRPICPCISFSFSPSLSTTEFPLSFSIHLAPGKQTPRRWHHQGMERGVRRGRGGEGWSAPLNHFVPQLLVK